MTGVVREILKGEGLAAGASSAESFAVEVVQDVLGGKTGKTYSGTLGWSAQWVGMFPQLLMVSLCYISLRRNANGVC